MIEWRFFLDAIPIDEPRGFADVVLEITRDDHTHGVMFEMSVSDLRFMGTAADYLREKKETLGLKAMVIFLAEVKCEGETDYVEFLKGKLNFGRYRESCGENCTVLMNVEQSNCTMIMKNRIDQKVDVGSLVAFDQFSALAPYDKINFDMDLPAKELLVGTQGEVELGGYDFDLLDRLPASNNYVYYIRPRYLRKRNESLIQSQLDPFGEIGGGGTTLNFQISPVVLFDDLTNCFNDEFNIAMRLKGSYNIQTNRPIQILKLIIVQTSDPNNQTPDEVFYMDVDLPHGSNTAVGTFDESINLAGPIKEGYGIYAFFYIFQLGLNADAQGVIHWDEETSVDITANKSCPTTTAKVSMVNETLSRVSEAITDNCLKVKSDYYGRPDSQPYASQTDGCGALRTLASGLQIRKAPDAKFFLSLKEGFDGLKAIDNIGMGIEPNPFIPGFDWLRIEEVSHFYQDVEVIRLPKVPNAELAIDESKHYSIVKIGYKKWEVQNVNGLDEPNSNKQFRTSLSAVKNTAELESALVSGSYAIEITRQQSFAVSGGADTSYDNETFIICVDRGAYGFQAEQGNMVPAGIYGLLGNVYSPDTLYNWRIRPYYNLMRWFKSLANSYVNLADPDSKLYFSSGTGNFLADGELVDGPYDAQGCKLELGSKAENDDLSKNDFLNEIEAIPLWRPEKATLQYPMSIKDYRLIKAQPYGYISFECGTTGVFLKGFIQQIKYKPTQGTADMTLKMKWQ